MPFGLADLLFGIVAPAVVAAALMLFLRRWMPGESTRSLATVLTFVTAYQAGYWLLAWRLSLAPLKPTTHWHWLPEALMLSVLVALPPLARPERRWPRLVAVLLVSLASAWVLVPTWEALEPSRGVHMAILVAAIVLITGYLEPLAQRYSSPAFLTILTGIMLSGAIVLALSGSLRFFQMAGCAVAALFGMWLGSAFDQLRQTWEGIAFPFTLLISALMLIGQVNSFSDVPLASYLLLPIAPLSLWIAEKGPLASAGGWKRTLLLSLPLLVCAVAVIFAVLPEFDNSSDW